MEPTQNTENSELISQTEQTQLQEQPPELFLVLVTEFDAPQLLIFNSPADVAACIKEHKETYKKFNVYIFEGKRWNVTAGRTPYLISYDRNVRIPLYDEDAEDDISEAGLIS